MTDQPTKPRAAVVSWDWREQPDLGHLANLIRHLTDGQLHLLPVDTGSPAARWAADYLEAVGPEGTTTRGEVTHRCPLPGAATTPCCGQTPFELPRTSRLTTDDALVTCSTTLPPAAAAQTGQDGAGVTGGSDEACTCPQIDASTWTGPVAIVKGFDPNCPTCSTTERTTP